MSPLAIIECLERLDVDTATQNDLERAGHLAQQLRGYLDVIDGKLARRATQLHEVGQCIPPEVLLAGIGRSSRRSAQRSQRRSETLGQAPAIEAQLAKGRISTEHADVLSAAAGKLDDESRADFLADDGELARAAASMTPERFRRFTNRRVEQLLADDGIEQSERQRLRASVSLAINEETGMGDIRGELHPEQFQRLRRALDGEVAALRKLPEHDGMRTDQLLALALVNVATDARSVVRRAPAEMIVVIDHISLMSGRHGATLCEYSDGAPLPVATARRYACDAEIIPVVLDGEGVPIDVGRAKRLATPEQRAALRTMYRTCAIGGCDHAFDRCEIHHLTEWLGGGRTDLSNLIPVCSHHHHRAHEGRWRLELDISTRELSVWLPSGTLLSRSRPDLIVERSTLTAANHAA